MTIPILLIPGINCTAELYAHQVPALWQFGPVTVANHTMGRSMAEFAGAILADAPPRFALAGFSMGGYIAFEILRQARDRVLRLALVDSSARPDTPEASEKRRSAIALAEQGKLNLVAAQGFKSVVHPDHAGDKALLAIHMRMSMAVGPEVYARQQQATITRPDARGELAGIECPTLVVVGDGDQLAPPEAAEEMVAGIPGARLVIVGSAGHLTPLEQPDAVTKALVEWLAQD